MSDSGNPVITTALPDIAAALVEALSLDPATAHLATQVPTLELWSRCGCADTFCASFYTGPRPRGTWSDEGAHQNLALDAEGGMIIIDVVDRTIRFIEVLDRPDVRSLLERLLPM